MPRPTLLRSTTALVLSVSLALPGPVAAQSEQPCGEGTPFPCPVDNGREAPAAEQPAQEQPFAAPAQEKPAQEQPFAAPAQEKPAQEQPFAAPAQEKPAQEQPFAAPAQEKPAQEQPFAAPAQEKPAQEQPFAAPAQEKPAQEQPFAAPAQEKPAQEQPFVAPKREKPAQEQPFQVAPAPEQPAQEQPFQGRPAAPAVAETGVDGRVPEVVQSDTAASAGAANVAPEVAASVGALGGVVVTERVTDADVRTSDENFEARVQTAPQGDRGGLSNFEKFAIAGVGLVALAAIVGRNDRVVAASPDRVVVERDGGYYVLKDDDTLLRRPGNEVTTRRFDDGSTLTTVYRPDGSRVVTIRAANGQVLRRARYLPDGREVLLFDDTVAAPPVQVARLPRPRPEPGIGGNDELRAALEGVAWAEADRRFTLQQIRQIRGVRELAPQIDIDEITFETGSAAIRASEAEKLRDLGLHMRDLIAANPYEVFLVEGHTDAIGGAAMNLALSDRRAESLALALTEYFDVPPESMIVQGYGEANLRINTQAAERLNRRVAVRRITELLRSAELR